MVESICICGAGTMGSGIAQVSVQAGIRTILFDLNASVLEKAKSNLEKNILALVDKQKISSEEGENMQKRLQYTSDIRECVADLVLEAIVEKKEAKVDLFLSLAGLNGPATIFASNTSSLSLTAIAENIPSPERVIGMHFFNPAPLMKLVELVSTEFTSERVSLVVDALARQMGKTPVHCKDAPGFIVNHVARPYYLEALHLIEEGISDMETIDALMESSGFRMGPFRLMDLIGNDINYAVSCSLYEALGKPARLKPSPIQEQKVSSGQLGKKTGRGYYDYKENK